MRVGGAPLVQTGGTAGARRGRQIRVDRHLAPTYAAQDCWLCPRGPWPCLGVVIRVLLVTEMAGIVPKTALELYGYHIDVGVIVDAAGLVVYSTAEDLHGSGPVHFTRRTRMSGKARCVATATADATASFTISPG